MTAKRYRLATSEAGPQRRGREVTVVVPGVSQGGPQVLTGDLIERLIEAERAGVHTVLLARSTSDLEADPASVCRYVVTDEPQVASAAEALYGRERVLRAESVALADIDAWIGGLPRPESQTLRRRIRSAVRRLPFAEAVYARLTSGRRGTG